MAGRNFSWMSQILHWAGQRWNSWKECNFDLQQGRIAYNKTELVSLILGST